MAAAAAYCGASAPQSSYALDIATAGGEEREAVGGADDEPGVYPLDEHNALLLDRVAPKHWLNPRGAVAASDEMYYDLVAIGAGAGGLVSAKQSARRGAKSALIEKHFAGGDCLNVGCVPSKALIRCARAAAAVRDAATFGVVPLRGEGEKTHAVDFGRVMARMRRIRADIAPADSLETSARVGAACFSGRATFTSPRTLRIDLGGGESGGVRNIRFGVAVIATGASAFVPTATIPGLAASPYHTNATLFNLTALPPRLVVLGAGPIGVEMAQAFALLGSEVTCVVRSSELLPREDRDAAAIVRSALERDGVTIVTSFGYEGVDVVSNDAGWTAERPCVNGEWPTLRLRGTRGGVAAAALSCECLLVATGRAPNVEGLGLEVAGVAFDTRRGIPTDDFLCTSNPCIYAVGDVANPNGLGEGYSFTHVAGTHAGMVVENALFGGAKRASEMVVPWTTFTEPEVAHVGVYGDDDMHDTYTSQLAHNDRAKCEGGTEGFVRVHCAKGSDVIVGATIVAAAAGELISELTLAIQYAIPLGATGVGGVIHCYPTIADAIGGASWGYKPTAWRKVERLGKEEPATLRIVGGTTAAAAASPSRGIVAGASQTLIVAAVALAAGVVLGHRWTRRQDK